MTPSNVLYINPTAKMSGAEFSLLSLLENLDKDRFKPRLLLPEEGFLSQKAREAGIEVLVLPSYIRFGERHGLSTLHRILASAGRVSRILKNKNIDILHCNAPRAAYIAGISAKLSGIPLIAHVRDIHLSPFSRAVQGRYLGYMSDSIIAVSQATKDSILKFRPELAPKVSVVYNGIDFKKISAGHGYRIRAELGLTPDMSVIGCVGILETVKGQDVLIRASIEIKREIPGLKVLIVGDSFSDEGDSFKHKLGEMVKRSGLEETILFTGFRSDVYDVMEAMDLYVHPAVYPDPFPRSLLEAAALGRSIISTRVGGVPELLDDGDSAVMVPPEDAPALARAVIRLLRDREEACRLARNAQKKVQENFTVESHVEKVAKVYDRFLVQRS